MVDFRPAAELLRLHEICIPIDVTRTPQPSCDVCIALELRQARDHGKQVSRMRDCEIIVIVVIVCPRHMSLPVFRHTTRLPQSPHSHQSTGA
jgi:hypothetical protein